MQQANSAWSGALLVKNADHCVESVLQKHLQHLQWHRSHIITPELFLGRLVDRYNLLCAVGIVASDCSKCGKILLQFFRKTVVVVRAAVGRPHVLRHRHPMIPEPGLGAGVWDDASHYVGLCEAVGCQGLVDGLLQDLPGPVVGSCLLRNHVCEGESGGATLMGLVVKAGVQVATRVSGVNVVQLHCLALHHVLVQGSRREGNHVAISSWIGQLRFKLPGSRWPLSFRDLVQIGWEPRRAAVSAVQRGKAILVVVALADWCPCQTFWRPRSVEEQQTWSEIPDISCTRAAAGGEGHGEQREEKMWHFDMKARLAAQMSRYVSFLHKQHAETGWMLFPFHLHKLWSESRSSFFWTGNSHWTGLLRLHVIQESMG